MSESGKTADAITRLEAELASAREAIRGWEQLANSVHAVISRIDARGRITYVSPSVRKLLGYEPHELVGQVAHGFLDPEQQAARRAGFERGLKEGVAPTVAARARRKDGSYVWMEYHTEVLRDADGNVSGFQSISYDVTAQEEAKAALEAFVRAMPVPGLVHRGGTIALVNGAFCTTFGFTEEAAVGRKVIDLIDPGDRAYIGDRLKKDVSELAGRPTREHHILHADGTRVPVEVTVVPILFRGESCTLAVFRDLRERKRLEAQLVTADRMASLGRLAAAVGHEINNPLAYILSSVGLLRREIEAARSPIAAELLGSVSEGAERIRVVADDLRIFSRERSDTYGPVDIVRLLDRAASMADHELRHRARLVKDYAELPAVEGNEARLGQVFLNLIVNAAQAIPDANVSGNEVRIEGRPTDDRAVAIDVVDTGVGIAPEDAQRIFEPFFSTKTVDGTGLGLSISNHIVTSLGGSLRLVSSRPGETRFRVVLPRAD